MVKTTTISNLNQKDIGQVQAPARIHDHSVVPKSLQTKKIKNNDGTSYGIHLSYKDCYVHP